MTGSLAPAFGGAGSLVLAALDPSGGPPASSVRDVAGFLDIDADQLVGPSRLLTRSPMIRRSVRTGVRRGLACGRDGRSAIPAAPSRRYRPTQQAAVV